MYSMKTIQFKNVFDKNTFILFLNILDDAQLKINIYNDTVLNYKFLFCNVFYDNFSFFIYNQALPDKYTPLKRIKPVCGYVVKI